MRYEVTELEGFLQVGGERRATHAKPGLSCMVVDTLWNHRVVGLYRSEDYARSIGQHGTHERARNAAVRHAARLNETEQPSEIVRHVRFTPTCPKCKRRCEPEDTVCVCGTALVPLCRNGHPRTRANTYYSPTGKRRCRICRKANGD